MAKRIASSPPVSYTIGTPRGTTTLAAAATPTTTGILSFRLTSMRWLEENHPEYVRTGGTLPAARRLVIALAAMSYLDAEDESGMLESTAAVTRAQRVDAWDVKEHEAMVQFLADGGYRERRADLIGDSADLHYLPMREEKIKGTEITAVFMDELDDIPDEVLTRVATGLGKSHGVAFSASNSVSVLIPQVGASEAEETMEDVILMSKSSAGSW